MDQRVSIPGRIQQNEWVTNPSRNDGWGGNDKKGKGLGFQSGKDKQRGE